MPRVNIAWDIDGQGNNVLRGGYGLFYNRNMGNVEYDNTLRLPPDIYSIDTDACGGASYGNGLGLTYDTLHEADAAEPARVGRHQHADAGLVHVPEDAQLQRLVRAAHALRPGARSGLRRHARPRPGEPRQRQRRAGRRAAAAARIGNADLSNPVHRVALDDARSTTFRPFQALPGHHGLRLRGRVELQLAAGHAEPPDQQAAAVLRRPTPSSRTEGTLGDEYRNRDPFNPARTYGIRDEDRTHIFNLSWNAFLPDPIRRERQRRSARASLNGWQLSGISTFASGIPIWLGFAGPAGSNDIAQAYYGTPDIVRS